RYIDLGPFSINHSKLVSTDEKLFSSSLYFSPSYYSNKHTSNGISSKNNSLQSSFEWMLNNRQYRKNKWFLEWGNTLRNNHQLQNSDEPVYGSSSKELRATNTFYLGKGKGRIENVQDAQVAAYIINDLQEQGLVSGSIDSQTLFEFAQLITDLNNRRIFDFRKRRIYELTRIDQFLREKNISELTDIRHFTVVNDNWSMAFNPLRQSGSSWYMRVLLEGFAYDWNSSMQTSVDNTQKTGVYSTRFGPQFGIEKYIPKNLKWQQNMGARITGLWNHSWEENKTDNDGTINENNTRYKYIQSRLNFFYSLGYFPNNRTTLNATANLDAFADFGLNNQQVENSAVLRPSLYISTDYFIGYRTRLQGGLSVLYEKYLNNNFPGTESRFISSSIYIGLIHTIY
ncbi:MAG: hypothetical protein ACXWCR_15565, partial [Flavitalea sp.]